MEKAALRPAVLRTTNYATSPLMQPKTVLCNNVRDDGVVCGENALVHMVHYIYDMQQKRGAADVTHVLRAISYDIECPRCGRWEQLVNCD
jgi:hypothetical protein